MSTLSTGPVSLLVAQQLDHITLVFNHPHRNILRFFSRAEWKRSFVPLSLGHEKRGLASVDSTNVLMNSVAAVPWLPPCRGSHDVGGLVSVM